MNGDAQSDHSSVENNNHHHHHNHYQPHFKFAAYGTRHSMRERKYKCSLCMRTSKWQWDVKKHMRTVHKGQNGEVIVLEAKVINTNRHHNNNNNNNHHNNNGGYQSPSAQSSISGHQQFSPSHLGG